MRTFDLILCLAFLALTVGIPAIPVIMWVVDKLAG